MGEHSEKDKEDFLKILRDNPEKVVNIIKPKDSWLGYRLS